jgi:thiamine-monophosphate kinase
MTNRPGEDDLIARYFAPIAGPQGLGLLDDAALLSPPPGADLVLTNDALVGGVHFFADDPPGAIARKALRVNLSDLAAKGARPLGFLLTLALPAEWTAQWLAAFANGLGEDSRDYGCPLFGGDTVKSSGPLMASITAIGAAPEGRMTRRTGVRPGDFIYVSGTIGDAALGLKLRLGEGPPLETQDRHFLLNRYLLPQPRGALASAIGEFAHGGMDVSDGFVGDLMKMMRVSGVGAKVDLSKMPLSRAARAAIDADPRLFEIAATGGDDYEILASVAPGRGSDFEAAASAAGILVTRVGVALDASAGVRFIDQNETDVKFDRGSYSHF